ncbi:MAG TPA: hypothetical protein VGH03_12355 [Caulobacteraceae bacterium]
MTVAAALGVAVLLKTQFRGGSWLRVGPVIDVCYADGEISPAKRKPIETEARTFIDGLLGDPLDAYAQMSTIGSAVVTSDQITTLSAHLKTSPQAAPVRVIHTLFIDSLISAPPGSKIPCSDASGPRGVEFVSFGPQAREAHVLLSEGLGNAERTFEVWLAQEDGAWRVNGFSYGLSSIAGHDGEFFWNHAKEQRARGNMFNAAFLYVAAATTLSRGPDYATRSWTAFAKDYASFVPPPELSGTLPFKWLIDGDTYEISSVQVVGASRGQLALLIDQPSPNWRGEQDAERRNHETIDAITAAHPEWMETFDAIVVRSAAPGLNRVFGSVYDKDKGYLASKPAN